MQTTRVADDAATRKHAAPRSAPLTFEGAKTVRFAFAGRRSTLTFPRKAKIASVAVARRSPARRCQPPASQREMRCSKENAAVMRRIARKRGIDQAGSLPAGLCPEGGAAEPIQKQKRQEKHERKERVRGSGCGPGPRRPLLRRREIIERRGEHRASILAENRERRLQSQRVCWNAGSKHSSVCRLCFRNRSSFTATETVQARPSLKMIPLSTSSGMPLGQRIRKCMNASSS